MGEIFVVGHKNPDTDSICSAYAYANLKNKVDSKHRYIAARCGSLNDQTKFVFSNIDDEPPVFIRDIFPKVKDVMTKEVIFSTPDEPIYNAVKNLESLGVRLTPIVDGQLYKGVVSILEISRFFLPNNIENKPEYLVRPENFKNVIPGDFIQIGEREEFLTHFLVGGMPFDTFLKRFKNLHADKTVLIVGKRRDFIEYAIKNNIAGVVITGINNAEEFDFDITDYKGFVYVSYLDTAETLRRIVFSVPIKFIMTDKIPITEPNFYIEDARKIMISENHRGLPVVENGKLVGIITRSDLLKDKKHKIILMDHNELSQSVDGVEMAEIVEIVDHHRLGTVRTKSPVTFFAKPVGSTCTLVFQQYRLNNVEIDEKNSLALLSGILSDTVVLKSPTMTNEDVEAVEFLSAKLGVDYREYGKKMFEASSKLKGRSPESIVATDFKIFEEQGYRIGIGQVETVNLIELNDIKQILLDEVKKIASVKNLNWASLLVTDIIEEKSVLLTSGFQPLENLLIYNKLGENIYDLPGVLSRKKQLLPEVLRVLELLKN
ncbi:putative manganese-dependent inorganic diphosphatase [Deferribacterales bacterium Es71-Z0220]|uniref:putative manganese-dependent inorganic diphosphatase n=1 Tax=Deferrivibrio essentukiensis TaxID=2880922 RepID=UPI001F60235E|nr:putative manganese-dependent inorganic diphosphatase [Deferrivibrio essentukiensis]MCB4205509.1 putative manganese-dependent inorganic diphosphatase [Deferrivibrio essentukiensis]